MSDTARESAALPSFDDCADVLLEAGLTLSPAELHGVLCGLRSAGFEGGPGAALAAVEQTLAVTLAGSAAHTCEGVWQSTGQLLGEERWNFQPLLPDDDLELPQRVAALAGWCRGFLGGYAQARLAAAAADHPVAADSAEALRDFAAIAQAGQTDDDEADEHNYMELVEYLRVATLNIVADSAAAAVADVPRGDGTRH
jgi:uncharacterized protein YgfB (UPF0149 family)